MAVPFAAKVLRYRDVPKELFSALMFIFFHEFIKVVKCVIHATFECIDGGEFSPVFAGVVDVVALVAKLLVVLDEGVHLCACHRGFDEAFFAQEF